MIALNWFDIVFFVFGLVLVASSVMVAFARNLIYSAFSLLGALVAVAVLFVLLSADFLAVTQILIYMGGILVLILFAIMLTSTIRDVRISNRSVAEGAAFLIALITFVLLGILAWNAPWLEARNPTYEPTTREIGNLLLSKYILPFEIASVLLLVAVVGAVVLARKEVKRP